MDDVTNSDNVICYEQSFLNRDRNLDQQGDREELLDPFDADNLTDRLGNNPDVPDGHWMAPQLNTDRVLMIVQVSMFALCFVFGLMVGISLGWAVNVNDMKCPLYAHLIITADKTNKSLTVDGNSIWGSDSSCNYSTFSSVCVAIYSLIWIWFFVLTTERDNLVGLPYDVNLLLPALLCSTVLFFVSLVSAGMVSSGYGTWCSYITQGVWKNVAAGSAIHCSDVKDLYWTVNPPASKTYAYLEYSVVGSWLLVIALGIKVTVCAVRVKQNYKVILKDDDDNLDLIDLYRRLDISYDIISTPNGDVPQGSRFEKYGSATLPKCAPKYVSLETDSSDEEPLEPQEESTRVLIDDLGLGASALHPDGIEAAEMNLRSDDPKTVKRRKTRLDSDRESRRNSALENLETIPETNV